MTRMLKMFTAAALLALAAGAATSGTLLAQSSSGSHTQHHPGAAPPPPSGAMPMQGGAGMMGMMGSGGSSMMMGGMMEHMAAMRMMHERPEGRLAFLRVELGITDAQLPQWNAYADAVRTQAKARATGMGAGMGMGMMGQGTTPQTWPDRLAAQELQLQQRLEAVRSLKTVASALYAVLTDTQKATADELLRGPMGGM